MFSITNKQTIGVLLMAEKRIKVHKHFYIYHDQDEKLDELNNKTEVDVTKITRIILDHFLKLPKDKQIKIIQEGRYEGL